jgi:hypothetical protein
VGGRGGGLAGRQPGTRPGRRRGGDRHRLRHRRHPHVPDRVEDLQALGQDSDLAHQKLRRLLGQPTSDLDFGIIDLEKIAMEFPGATRAELSRMLDIFEQARLDMVPHGKRVLNSANPISEDNLPKFEESFKHPLDYYYKYKTPGFDVQ